MDFFRRVKESDVETCKKFKMDDLNKDANVDDVPSVPLLPEEKVGHVKRIQNILGNIVNFFVEPFRDTRPLAEPIYGKKFLGKVNRRMLKCI